MTPTTRTLLAMGVVLAALGCTSAPPLPSGTVSPTSQPSHVTTTSSVLPDVTTAPTASAPPAPSASPVVPGPAWQQVLDSINDDGSVSKDTALQAFSVAFGPLPGVSVPSGDAGFVGSGTMALQWLVGYWDQLTSDQQQAAIAMIPELAGLGARASTVFLASQSRTNDVYTQLAKDYVAKINLLLKPGVPFNLTIEARVGLPVAADSWAETSVLSATGDFTGTPAKCVIVVSKTGDALSEADARLMMAHEAWHCYQGQIEGLQRSWFNRPAPWITEGQAEWVGDSLEPDAPVAQGAWPGYLPEPERPLFKRAYAAVGFYSQLDSSGTDPWTVLKDMLDAKDNTTAFAAAHADGDAFLDQWASGFLRDASRGQAWDITGPGVTQDRADPVPIMLTNDFEVTQSIPAYTDEISVFAQTPDVLTVSGTGHVRLSDAAGHDYVGGGDFCMLDTGCDCPDNTSDETLPPLAADSAAFALTAGTADAVAKLDGTKLSDFCSKVDLTGNWTGTWAISPNFGTANGGFTMTITQKGSAFSGTTSVTGPTCVRTGNVSGTVTGNSVKFGWVTEVARPVQFEGTVTGSSMSGTWTAISCEPNSLAIDGSWAATKDASPSAKP